jgi:DNA-binding MurR/RpiR family transcriptional regulator
MVGRLKEALPGLKPTPRKIALCVLEDPQSVSFSSIQALARLIGVNEAAIVRFTRSLGFTGFAEFKKTVQEAIRTRLSPYGQIAMHELSSLADDRRLRKLIGYETDNVRRTLDGIRLGSVTRMVAGLAKADRVFLAGFGATRFIVELYGFLLTSNLGKPAIVITGSVGDFVGRLDLVGAGDVLVVASLPPYSREDLQVARLARERGAPVFLFTDSPRCPVFPLSDEVMACSSTSLLYTNSYTGLIASFKVLTDMWLLGSQKESSARMKALTDMELQGYEDLCGAQARPGR